MKIKTLLFLGIFAIAILPANAELTTSDVRSRDYLMNHGHSSATADIVQMQNDSVNGVKSDLPIHHRFDNKSLGYKWVNKSLYIWIQRRTMENSYVMTQNSLRR